MLLVWFSFGFSVLSAISQNLIKKKKWLFQAWRNEQRPAAIYASLYPSPLHFLYLFHLQRFSISNFLSFSDFSSSTPAALFFALFLSSSTKSSFSFYLRLQSICFAYSFDFFAYCVCGKPFGFTYSMARMQISDFIDCQAIKKTGFIDFSPFTLLIFLDFVIVCMAYCHFKLFMGVLLFILANFIFELS